MLQGIKKNRVSIVFATFFAFTQLQIKGQSTQNTANYNQLSGQDLKNTLNPITTAVPFLMISPDARAGGIGDGGVATSADVYSVHWNASKLAFVDKQMGVGLTYTPWLRALNISDINLEYLSGYYKTKSSGVFAGSVRYFTLGEINFTDINANPIGSAKPNEFAVDLAYARKLSQTFSMGGAVRYINSSLTKGTFVDGSATHVGRSVAVDVSATYKKDNLKLGDKKAMGTIGLNFSNIGAKIAYTANNSTLNVANFLPMNMRFGGGLTIKMDDYNSLTIIGEANKLLVPTPPVYKHDSNGNLIVDSNGNYEVEKGKNPNRGIASGVFGSFSDAPGGSSEELHEINYSTGLEYWYNKMFAVRAGYFYEHPTKGNRKYITMGASVKYNVFGIDFAYLIPTSKTQTNPLANTLRVGISLDFDAVKAQEPVDDQRVD